MLTIVWDVDDVLNDLMRSWFHGEWVVAHPECPLRYEDISENPPDAVLGITRAEYLASLDRYRLSPQAQSMEPHSAFLDWFHEHGCRCRHLALTGRPADMVAPLAEWVFRHFGSWIRTFSYVPSRSQNSDPAYVQSKAEFLNWLGKADVFIDDSRENVDAAAALGITAVLVPQPWNRCPRSLPETLCYLTEIVSRGELTHT